MKLLALDTSSGGQSVAILDDGRVVASIGLSVGSGGADRIVLLVEEALSSSGITIEEIGALAVSKGPGTLTGLRVGIGAAQGIAVGADKPLVGVSTLRAIASGLGPGPPVLVLLEAGRGELYGGLFEAGDPPESLGPEQVGSPEGFSRAAGTLEIRLHGPAASRHAALFPSASLEPEAAPEHLACRVGRVALSLLEGTDSLYEGKPHPAFVDLRPAPRYLLRETGPIDLERR